MKCLALFLFLLFSAIGSQAQTFSEWFKQKKTQIKYLVQQIAANQAYIEQLQKGYRIARQGLNFIGDIKDGHFRLDERFFASLSAVSSEIRNYKKVGEIIAMNARIIRLSQSTLKDVKESSLFSESEQQYVSQVVNGLLDGCIDLTEGLMLVITPSQLKLSDDERLRRIDGLHEEVKQQDAFMQSFSSECQVLALQKQREQREASLIRKIYGIQP
ncbi:MAG: hypothetical protein J0I32_23450 [Sphingobacteriales bacterium]|nr:hypothetical protein [Sphingobacteriales bacterium]